MAGSGGGRRKRIWISSIVALLVVGGTVALVSFSAFSDSSNASTDAADTVAAADAAGGADDGESTGDPAEGEAEGEDGERGGGDEGDSAGEGEVEEGEKKDEPDPVPVEVATVLAHPISSYLSTTANLEAENHARILSELEGLVVEIRAEEGERVRKGDVLALLHEADRRIRLQKASLKVQNEETNFARAERMFRDKLISQEEYDRVQYQFRVARQEQEEAAYFLSRTAIRAPFDGVVSERFVKEGNRVKPTDPLFALVSYDPLVAKIYLPERDVFDLRIGDEVMLSLNAVEGTRFPGTVSLISPVVDPATGTVKITVEVSKIPGNVRPGSFVSVNIVRETHRAALTVPRKAVIRDLQDHYVFVVDGEEARKRKVETGFEEDGHIEILAGLEDGETIVTVGQGGLKDGTKVEVIDA